MNLSLVLAWCFEVLLSTTSCYATAVCPVIQKISPSISVSPFCETDYATKPPDMRVVCPFRGTDKRMGKNDDIHLPPADFRKVQKWGEKC